MPRFRLNHQESTRRWPTKGRLVEPDGSFNIVRLGTSHTHWRDPYHYLLILPWHQFLGLIALLYIVGNTVFAFLYLLDPGGIANAHPGAFTDAFFFSVQTMASIGYGAMYPQTLYTNLIVTVESLMGLLGLAMATGLMFARFSRPTAKVLFSRVAVVLAYQGVPTLMLRTANQRQNRILEAQMRLTFVKNEVDDQGGFMRRFYDMELLRSQTPIFALTWTVMHPIRPDSPLYGISPEELDSLEAEVVVTLTGLDETFSQTIHSRYSYVSSEILWQMRFVDILLTTSEGRRAIDYQRFHDVVPL